MATSEDQNALTSNLYMSTHMSKIEFTKYILDKYYQNIIKNKL